MTQLVSDYFNGPARKQAKQRLWTNPKSLLW